MGFINLALGVEFWEECMRECSSVGYGTQEWDNNTEGKELPCDLSQTYSRLTVVMQLRNETVKTDVKTNDFLISN